MAEPGRWLAMLLGALLWSTAGTASAVEHEVFIDVDDEDELLELYVTDQISESTYLTLVELLRRGTDLDVATREALYALPNLTYADVDRILAHRAAAGHITDPAALVAAGVLDPRTAAALAAFITVGTATPGKAATHGFVHYRTVWTVRDERAPPMLLQARVTAVRHLSIGMTGVLNRNRLGKLGWDPQREALVAEPNRVRPQLTKAFVQWDTDSWGVIAGSYRIGFAQRLTFDNSGSYTPNGFGLDDAYYRRVELTRLCHESAGELDAAPCDPNVYVTPDFRQRYGLLGVAAGAKHVEVGKGWMQAYGFFSYQPRDLYQYQAYDRRSCADPRDGDDEGCAAPPVYKALDDPLTPTSRFSYQSLPNMFALVIGGANVSWFADRRTHVGVTGYGATPRWLTRGADTDFRPNSILPYGGAFGAVGVDASWGHRWADLSAEISRSFDHQHGPRGGYAAIVRQTSTWDVHELELSARFYGKAFDNPFARPIAALDQSAGLRASDEAGVRVRYNATLARQVIVRALLDVWSEVSAPHPKVKSYAHVDWYANKWVQPGLWVDVQDRDARAGTGADAYCDLGDYADGADDPSPGNPSSASACSGERYSLAARMAFQPHPRVALALQYRHDFTDDSHYPHSVRHDANGYFMVSTRPIDPLRIRARVRFYDDDLLDNHRFERSVWLFVDVSYRVARWLTPRIRYDFIQRLDRRPSTAARDPVPEHWLWLELESRF